MRALAASIAAMLVASSARAAPLTLALEGGPTLFFIPGGSTNVVAHVRPSIVFEAFEDVTLRINLNYETSGLESVLLLGGLGGAVGDVLVMWTFVPARAFEVSVGAGPSGGLYLFGIEDGGTCLGCSVVPFGALGATGLGSATAWFSDNVGLTTSARLPALVTFPYPALILAPSISAGLAVRF